MINLFQTKKLSLLFLTIGLVQRSFAIFNFSIMPFNVLCDMKFSRNKYTNSFLWSFKSISEQVAPMIRQTLNGKQPGHSQGAIAIRPSGGQPPRPALPGRLGSGRPLGVFCMF